VNILCAAPTPTKTRQNPHNRSAITVYVNNIGIKAMMSPKSALFPTGSVIIKKKIDPQSLEDAVLLYTVMIKHNLAFNPKVGGWEFAVVSGNPPQIQSRGDLASCRECHIQQKQNDYVFRTYR
jgi:Cytochrome P460